MKEKSQFIFNIIIVVAVIGAFAYRHLEKHEIVYVDSNKLLNGYQGMVDARTT